LATLAFLAVIVFVALAAMVVFVSDSPQGAI